MSEYQVIEPATPAGDMIALYDSVFYGTAKLYPKENIIDISDVKPIYPDKGHYKFFLEHLESLGLTVRGARR